MTIKAETACDCGRKQNLVGTTRWKIWGHCQLELYLLKRQDVIEMVRLFFNIWPITTEKVAQNVVVAQSVERSLPTPEVYPIIGKLFYWTFNCLLFFLLNIFIDHHTVNSHLLMHVYNTDTVYELNSGQKKSDIFTFTVPI